MALFHQKKNKKNTKDKRARPHLNWMGGPSFDISDPLLKLRLAASTCFFGEPMYYHRDATDKRPLRRAPAFRLTDEHVAYLRDTLHALDPQDWRGLAPTDLMEKAIDEALAADPVATLDEAVRLRQEEHIRTTPQVILVRAANHEAVRGSGLVRKYAKNIIARADEPSVGLAYQMFRYGKPVPNALKRAWRDALEGSNDYALAKYKMENRAVKTVDVVNLVHPKSAVVDQLVRGNLKVTGKTWEAVLSRHGSNRQTWKKALPLMGHMALLRNLRNLTKAGVDPDLFIDKLVKGAATGKQLPFRYYSAYQALGDIGSSRVLGAVEQCLMESLGNVPKFPGRVMALCDNSGSAQGTTTSSMGTMRISTIANLTGVLTGMRADCGFLGVFGDRLETFRVRSSKSVFDQLDKAELMTRTIGGATENGIWLFWDQAIREKEHWDTVFVFSDMQAGHGGLYGTNARTYANFRWAKSNYIDVPKLITTYRKMVNPNVRVFLVQVAGYQDTIVPEFYDRTYILGGWGEGLLRFAAEMAGLNVPTQVQRNV